MKGRRCILIMLFKHLPSLITAALGLVAVAINDEILIFEKTHKQDIPGNEISINTLKGH